MSDSEVIFEITKAHIETGLRGMPVGYCPTSKVDPKLGLYYGGYPIADLAEKNPEEVIYLLLNRELPDDNQLQEFKTLLQAHSSVDAGIIDHIKSLPKTGHPMKWFISGLNAMGMFSKQDDYEKDCINLIAQLPEVVAAIYRVRSGWGDPLESKPELGYMENFTRMLGVPGASPHLENLMRVFNILHYDHGGGNLSTFVGKAVASGLEDMFGSIIAAMSGLAGPLHGKANQECLNFIKMVLDNVPDPEDEPALEAFLQDHFNKGGKIYGFGHAVLRVEDPRATVQYDLGEEICPDDKIFKMAKNLRKTGVNFLKKNPKVSNPYPNVDAISGTLLNASGLTDESYYTVLFGLSRSVGIAAQIVYERVQARGGKGTPIVRPKYLYTGPTR